MSSYGTMESESESNLTHSLNIVSGGYEIFLKGKRMKMKTAHQAAVEALTAINITPKVYLLIIDGKYVEAYASKETAEYEMHLCMQADEQLDETHVYRIREMDINFTTL